jgi:hypothetical protein
VKSAKNEAVAIDQEYAGAVVFQCVS